MSTGVNSVDNYVVEVLGGVPGAPGRGIVSLAAVSGQLIVTYTDNATQNLGALSGLVNGIAGVTVDQSNHLIVTYSNGDKADAGSVGQFTTSLVLTADGHINNGDPVIASAANRVLSGNASDLTQTGRFVGIALNAAEAGGFVNVQPVGVVTNAAWNWSQTPGSALYVAGGGGLTATPPTSGWVQPVAHILSTTSIVVVRSAAFRVFGNDTITFPDSSVLSGIYAIRDGQPALVSPGHMNSAFGAGGSGGSVGFGITRNQIPSLLLSPSTTALFVQGINALGDAPMAQYIRGVSGGPMAIQDGSGAWWQLDIRSQNINPRLFGAKGDLVSVIDGSIAQGSAILTSNAAGFKSTDIGKKIYVAKAGAGGWYLITTIQNVSGNTAILNAVASASVSSAEVHFGTDDSAAIQAAFNAATADISRARVVEFDGGRYLFGTAVQATVPGGFRNGLYNGIEVRGAGPYATKFVAAPDNTSGLLKLITSTNRAVFTCKGFQCVSLLLQNDPVNRGRNNGTAIQITDSTGTPDQPLNGLFTSNSVRFEEVEVSGDSADEGYAILWGGIWNVGILVQYRWAPHFERCVIRCGDGHGASQTPGPADVAANYPAMTTSGGAVDWNQGRVGIYLQHCYLPCLIRCLIGGFWKQSVLLESTLTQPGASGRLEGYLNFGCEVAGSLYGLMFTMAYMQGGQPYEPDIFSDEVRIIGGQFQCLINDISMDRWQDVVIMGTQHIIQTTANWGENFPAAINLASCSNVRIIGSNFVGAGFVTRDGSNNVIKASCCVRINFASTFIVIQNPQFNVGGYSVYATASNSNWPTAGSRNTVRVSNAVYGGRTNSLRAEMLGLFDPNASIIETRLIG